MLTAGVLARGVLATGVDAADATELALAPGAVEVVVAPKAPATVRFACDELTNFLSRVLSCDIPVVTQPSGKRPALVLGQHALARAAGLEVASLARDGFIIRTETNRVYICGRDDPQVDPAARIRQGSVGANYEMATLFGVYEFLERYAGCRFFFPGEMGTVVPSAKKIMVPIGEVRLEPAFTSRSAYVNGSGVWYDKPSVDPLKSSKALAWLRWRLETYPIPCCHGQNKFQITERFAKTHPEYFALRADGSRYTVVPPGAPEDWRVKQLCHTSGVWDEMYRDTASYLKGEDASVRGIPSRRTSGVCEWGVNCFDRKYVDIMPQDGMVECRCATCQATYAAYPGSRHRAASDLIWRNTATLASRLKREGIPGTVTMMAYEQYLDVPAFELPDNILVVVAQFGPWSLRDPSKTAGEIEMFRRWHEKMGRKVRTWTYPGKWHATDIKGVPCLTPRAVGRYYQMAAPHIIGGFAETDCDRAIFQYLNTYVFAKVAWNPALDVEALLRDHHAKMFGAGAPWMAKFYDELEDAWLNRVIGNTVETPIGPQTSAPDEFTLWRTIYSPETRTRWHGYFEAAHRAVPLASAEAKRLAFVEREFLACLDARAEAHFNMTDKARGLASRKTPAATSLITNGTFETTLAGWRVGGKGGKTVLDDTVRMTGKRSVRLTATGEERVDLRYDLGATMKPDTEYRLSYFMKTKDIAIKGNGGGVYPEIWDGRYRWFADLHAGAGSLDWTYCEKTFRTAAKFDAKFPPFVHFFINGSGTVWFDDVRLEEVVRPYDIEIWELSAVTNGAVRAVYDETLPEPKHMGGKRIGLGSGMRMSRMLPIEEGTEYTLAFEGLVEKKEDAFIIYGKVFDANGQNVSAACDAVAGWQYSLSSDALARYPVKLPATGTWQRVTFRFLAPPAAKGIVFEVSGWSGRDIACRSISIEACPRCVRRRLDSSKNDIRLDVTEELRPCGATAVRATVTDLAKPHRPRALQVVLAWHRDLTGWNWHKDWRTDKAIGKAAHYATVDSLDGLAVSTYPFSAVSKNGTGFALGTPFDAAAFEHRVVTATGIRSTVAVGLLERGADRHGTSATCEWLMIPFAGDWGFRSAARAYYDVEAKKFPPSHAGAKEGAWLFATYPTKVPENPNDFGLTFWEAPETVVRDYPQELARARELGILPFAYTEAWGMRQDITQAADGSFPSNEAIDAELRQWAGDFKSQKIWFSAPRHEAAQALLNTRPVTPTGKYPHSKDFYSSWAAWWSTNPDPRLPRPNRASLCWDRRIGNGIDRLDGLYLDSVSYAPPITFFNVRPEHLDVMDENLVYDPQTLKPCANGMQHEVTFIRWLADMLHPAHKRLFANIAGVALRFHADTIDIFGGEIGSWGAPDNVERAHRIFPDEWVCQRRFFARHRPLLSLLQEGHWTKTPPAFSAQGMTNFVDHQVFYAMYPGVSTIGGDEKPGYATWRRYFGPHRQCERDRELFRRAIPLIREMNKAGWEPETFFRTGHARVWAERYGTPGCGKVFLSVRNAQDKPADADLRGTISATGLKSVWGSGREPQRAGGAWRVRLDPWETAVYELTDPSW